MAETVLVNRYRRCDCGHPAYESDHLSHETVEVPIEHGNAVALSYAIGDFDRVKYIFGHHVDDVSRQTVVELGGEWNVEDVKSLFVKLSEDVDGIWFDQHSIVQTPVAIQVELQRVPTIYRTFEVVVILPNEPCSCLAESVRNYEDQTGFVNAEGDLDIVAIRQDCLHAFPISSYQLRLWTKEEFMYARKVSIRYASKPVGRCSKGVSKWIPDSGQLPQSQRDNLGSYGEWKHDSLHARAGTADENANASAWYDFLDHLSSAFGALCMSVFQFNEQKRWAADDPTISASLVFLPVAKLYLQQTFERGVSDMEDLISFQDHDSGHQASMLEDMVLAVFPRCAQYQIPTDWQTMGFPELLTNALRQYEAVHGGHIISKLPRGLFQLQSNVNRSFSCQPSWFLRPQAITCLRDVYGPIKSSIVSTTPRFDLGRLFIKDLTAPMPAFLVQSRTYERALGHRSTSDVVEFLKQVGPVASARLNK